MGSSRSCIGGLARCPGSVMLPASICPCGNPCKMTPSLKTPSWNWKRKELELHCSWEGLLFLSLRGLWILGCLLSVGWVSPACILRVFGECRLGDSVGPPGDSWVTSSIMNHDASSMMHPPWHLFHDTSRDPPRRGAPQGNRQGNIIAL